MNDLSFGDDGPKRELHGDVLLKVDEILDGESAVVGTDLRTGEVFKVKLATPEDMAKHFVSPRDSNRTFEERLASARKRIEDRPTIMPDPDDDTALHVEVGSVLGLENVRSFTGPDGEQKTAAVWPSSLVRNPLQEAVIVGSVQASYFETDKGQRVELAVIRDQDAGALKDFDMDGAFSGEWDGLPLTQTGVVISMRNGKGETTVSSLTTPYRKHGEPSVEAALDAPQGSYQIYAAAVVAAVTGARSFDDLKINDKVTPSKVENARKIYDHLVANKDSNALEISVMPMAKTSFIPAKALSNFLKDFHGTKTGKPSETATPDPKATYQGKGFVPSTISMSRHPDNPDTAPASARLVSPENRFSFAKIGAPDSEKDSRPPTRIVDLGQESVVRIHGETFGANGPQAQPEPEQEQSANRKRGFDKAPGL
ncbi:MAG: hypothetical protein ORO03_06450 [Alphaproteobacteria bacterium]|nr:hypothetical protein [Alphaproteobacteria bacterium]